MSSSHAGSFAEHREAASKSLLAQASPGKPRPPAGAFCRSADQVHRYGRDITAPWRRFENSGLDDDVAVLDVNGEGFGDIRPLRERFAVLDHNRIGSHLDAFRIEPGLSVAHVELPSVPGAAQQFADPRALVDAGLRRGQARNAGRLVERRAGMGTTVEQREELAIDVKYDDVAPIQCN